MFSVSVWDAKHPAHLSVETGQGLAIWRVTETISTFAAVRTKS